MARLDGTNWAKDSEAELSWDSRTLDVRLAGDVGGTCDSKRRSIASSGRSLTYFPRVVEDCACPAFVFGVDATSDVVARMTMSAIALAEFVAQVDRGGSQAALCSARYQAPDLISARSFSIVSAASTTHPATATSRSGLDEQRIPTSLATARASL